MKYHKLVINAIKQNLDYKNALLFFKSESHNDLNYYPELVKQWIDLKTYFKDIEPMNQNIKTSKKGRQYFVQNGMITFLDTGETRPAGQSNNYNQRSNYNQRQNSNKMNNQQIKKSSYSVKMMKIDSFKEPVPFCSGFKRAGKGNGIIELYARPSKKKSKILTGKQNGRKMILLFVTLTNSTLGTIQHTWGMFHFDTQRLIIDELNLIGSPKGQGVTGTGKKVKGYFGKNQ